MLPLQLNNQAEPLPNRIRFLAKLILLSALVHVLIVLVACCVHERAQRLVLSGVASDQAPIVMMPFIKHVPQQTATPVQPATSLPATIERDKPRQSQTVLKKIDPVKKPPKKVAPDQQKKLVEPARATKPINEQHKVASDVAKKAQAEQQQSVPDVAQPVLQPTPEPEHIAARASLSATTTIADINAPPKPVTESLVVGLHDMELLNEAREVKAMLERDWIRPSGVSEYAIYKAVICVDRQGALDLIDEQGSGVLLLDLQARNFILSYQFPQAIWGREIEIIL